MFVDKVVRNKLNQRNTKPSFFIIKHNAHVNNTQYFFAYYNKKVIIKSYVFNKIAIEDSTTSNMY